MPLAVSSTTFRRGIRDSVDERQAVARVVLGDGRGRRARPGRRRRLGIAAGDQPLADLLDPGVARERERPAPDDLRPVPLLGVVGGRHDRAAVEVVARDVVVQHVGRDDADVGDRGALRARARDERRGELGRREPAVAPDRDLAGAEVVDERPPDAAIDLGVELARVEAADVVGLEDTRRDRGHAAPPVHFEWSLTTEPSPSCAPRTTACAPMRTPGPSRLPSTVASGPTSAALPEHAVAHA